MTPTIEAPEVVLKTDEVGRVRTPASRREQLLDEFERSGLSGLKFAALVGVKYPTFAAWLIKRRRARGAPGEKPVKTMRWLEAVVQQAHDSTANPETTLILELPGAVRVPIHHSSQIPLAAALVRALEPAC